MSNVVVYTAMYGPHDNLKVQPAITGVDYVCFTDQAINAPGWDVVKVQSSMPDRLAAKDPKMRPNRWVRRWRRPRWRCRTSLLPWRPALSPRRSLRSQNSSTSGGAAATWGPAP